MHTQIATKGSQAPVNSLRDA